MIFHQTKRSSPRSYFNQYAHNTLASFFPLSLRACSLCVPPFSLLPLSSLSRLADATKKSLLRARARVSFAMWALPPRLKLILEPVFLHTENIRRTPLPRLFLCIGRSIRFFHTASVCRCSDELIAQQNIPMQKDVFFCKILYTLYQRKKII